MQQTQLDVMSRGGGKTSQVEGKSETLIETLQDTVKIVFPSVKHTQREEKIPCPTSHDTVCLQVSVHFHMVVPLILPRGEDSQVRR